MDQKIKAQDTTFGEFHKTASVIYAIPSLQRPYTWDKKDVERLWDDILENPPGYYVGSIVAIVDGGTISRDLIIDGQQRLTSLSLILAGLKKYISPKKSEEFRSIEEEIDEILIKYGKNSNQVRLAFSDGNSDQMYQSIVFGTLLSEANLTKLQKRFINNYKSIEDRIKKYFPKCKINEIRNFVDKIKKLQLIFIKCLDRSAAFSLFESINDTGVSLATTDLLKNAIFEAVSGDKEKYAYVEENWKKMFRDFSEDSKYLKTYIRHHWIGTHYYVSHANLFDSFVKEYKNKELEYARSLFELSNIYLSIRNAQTESLIKLPKKRFEVAEIKEVLTFLSFLGVDQVYSVLLYIYQNGISTFVKDLNKLVAFQFLYKYIPGSPSVPEKKYFANYCEGQIDKQKFFSGLTGLCIDQKEQFIKNFFDRIKYIEGKSGDIQFVLERVAYKMGGVNKFAEATIEHIVPQDDTDPVFKNFKLDNDEVYRLIHQIGNLTVMERSENSDRNIFNQNLVLKFPNYKKHYAKINQAVDKYNFLSDPESAIKKRGQNIASQAFDLFMDTLKTGKWK